MKERVYSKQDLQKRYNVSRETIENMGEELRIEYDTSQFTLQVHPRRGSTQMGRRENGSGKQTYKTRP